jgi:hypothetical protein
MFENAGKSAGFDGVMIGNNFVVLTVALRCYPDVGTLLPCWFIAQNSEHLDQTRTVDITRKSHWIKTSSRTKWRRMILGESVVSSK